MSALLPDKGAPRLLAVATLVNMTGYGIYLTAGVLYFTRIVDLSAGQIGAGLSAAGAVALLSGIPAGHLADRLGARSVYTATLLIGAVAMAGLCVANDFWSFLIFVSLGSIAQTAGPAARSPLIQEYGGDRPAKFRGYLRSVTNLGIAAGALFAGWGVAVDTDNAYVLLIAGSALSYAACAAIVLFLPRVAPRPSGAGPRWIALRDRPYLVLTVLDGLMAVQYRVLTAAVPLWLVSRTDTPHWTVSAVMLVNTAIVVLFQVRVGSGVDTPGAGANAFRKAGFAFFISCAAISLMAGAATWLAMLLLLTAVVVHTIGEIWHSAGGFELSFTLAPAHAVGQYQGLFGMGLGLGVSIGPALLIALCIQWGRPGWWVVGALFAVTGLAVPATVRWAERVRERAVAQPEPSTV
ncbi:MFS transporter [Kineosporia sp. NBRC 101731]|uniref:MFS transporter n=1 Tax=Kineosporia sp. NBRC 101731 TaxID=3032199 RepID=UPI0024A10CA4|nr:MFS transporter [Kineosporia sp. NBRC 101731]GLY30936.1 MFS transporter [Kineosporia sp. NBRC 101731]